MPHVVETTVAGRPLRIETGKFAPQAEGSALISYGDTTLLVTSVSRDHAGTSSYFPLQVEIVERFYAAGKIKGSRFVKREGRSSDWAILTARLTDRAIRPLWPKESRNEVQVIATILSVDFENMPETLALIGASAALSISAAPFEGPIGAVIVGYVEGRLVINPTYEQMEKSSLNLTVAGTREGINMVEAGANEIAEEIMIEALTMAHTEIKKIVALQVELAQRVGATKKIFTQKVLPAEKAALLRERFSSTIAERIAANAAEGGSDADTRTKKLFNDLYEQLAEFVDEEHDEALIHQGLFDVVKGEIRRSILENKTRPDGRQRDQVRHITSEVGLLPTNHGTALFNRGGTQALTIATLGAASDAQLIDSSHLEEEYKKRYIHYYNALPYSVGETGRMGWPKRREIGHGDLAERALEPVLPAQADFPYTMLLVSEVLAQNGSSSMASVCGSTLSLMDAGVPIARPVSGIAMGLVWEDENNYAILSDIQAIEDFCGDMDFKVAGTERGITALQMDIKVKSLSHEVLSTALAQAKAGRAHILGEMLKTLAAPRPELSPYAPKIRALQINPEKIRMVIGTGGKVINKIIEDTGVKIDIEDSGLVMFTSHDAAGIEEAMRIVSGIVADAEVGKIYDATVIKIMDFGAFVEFLPGKEGLVHISHLAPQRVEQVTDILHEGDKLRVKLMEIDRQGRFNLSKKVADAEDAANTSS